MKTVKFRDYLVPLVLSGEKTATWRLFDDKDLQAGDEIALLEFGTTVPFAHARILRVVEKSFESLTDADMAGHERYADKEEMYQRYAGYYKRPVGPETVVKIIHFELVRP